MGGKTILEQLSTKTGPPCAGDEQPLEALILFTIAVPVGRTQRPEHEIHRRLRHHSICARIAYVPPITGSAVAQRHLVRRSFATFAMIVSI
jgi:hypothetical protein